MNRKQVKVILPRTGANEFWQLVQEHYATEDPLRWKYLAMLALRENAGWPLEQIGLVFNHSKGHVVRCLEQVKKQLRRRFRNEGNFEEIERPERPLDPHYDYSEHFISRNPTFNSGQGNTAPEERS